jgi:predicted nucleic acid-binding protein
VGHRPTGSPTAVTGYCLDTDVISAVLKPAPPLHLIRRLAVTPAECQFTTAITVGDLIYGAARRGNAQLTERIQHLIHDAGVVLPFDEVAAHTHGGFRATLEQGGRPLAEPDLGSPRSHSRISSLS